MTLASDPLPEGVRTRTEVLRAVTRLIGEHGIDGMTMREVSRATGMSTGTINYHFTNKRSLILAALDAAPAAPATGEAGGPLERLQALFRGFILEDPDRRAWWRFWVEVTAQAARDAELRERQRTRMETQRREVEDLVSLGVQRGDLRAELDPNLIAEPLLALAHGLAIQQLISPDAATVRRASDAIEGSIREISSR
ncbi:MAG: TetR family transcriptional regulator [Dehalococcoidia bacterium]|nr:TetR family transcriptional regulator [Dehalococcoidia bacterium]MCB9482948.1 TetR family transcriptional regulator [Dehalococcoidia bacterium]